MSNDSQKIVEEMRKEFERSLAEMVIKVSSDGSIINVAETPVNQIPSAKCPKCKYVYTIKDNEQVREDHFISCPNCSYPFCVYRYGKPVPKGFIWIEDSEGNPIRDFDNNIRRFDDKEEARLFLLFCGYDVDNYEIRIVYPEY